MPTTEVHTTLLLAMIAMLGIIAIIATIGNMMAAAIFAHN